MANQRMTNVLTGIVALCCVLVTGLAVRREFWSRPRARNVVLSPPEAVKDWPRYASGGQQIGPSTAAIKIIEFSDFQCPYCQRLNETLRLIRAEYPSQVQIIYHHYPLARHAHARPAAIASECAAHEGLFAAMADVFFLKQDSIGRLSWTEFARRAGVKDTARFAKCLSDDVIGRRVDADRALAAPLEITGTPTVLVNGWRLRQSATKATLARLIDQELQITEARSKQ